MRNKGMTPAAVALPCGLTALVALGCSGENGTHPHDMSVAGHLDAAEHAELDATLWDQTSCGSIRPSDRSRIVCWRGSNLPIQQEREQVAQLRALAARHRAAASALVATEERACATVSEADRDVSPFHHREDIVSAEPLREPFVIGGQEQGQRTIGARIVFRAVPGLTAEWLQVQVDCHIARAAVLGHDLPEMSFCPLVPKGVRARVSSAGNGFAVEVTSDDADTAAEIVLRAGALVGTPQAD